MANTYDKGDSVRLRGIFTVTGTATDPSIVNLQIRDPSGNIDLYSYAGGTVTKGQWWWEFFGSGTVLAAGERYLIVEKSVIP